MEEAEEEIEKISNNLPAWRVNQQDEEALTTTRRSFHTLKGSGRLIGAEIIGEVAWYYESILNKVINHTLEVTLELHEILNQSIKALQQLLTQLKSGQIPSIDIQTLMVSAQHFCTHQGKSNKSDSAGASSENAQLDAGIIANVEQNDVKEDALVTDDPALNIEIEENIVEQDLESEEAKELEASDDFDAELHEIFILEATQHIATLEAIIHNNKDVKILEADEKMIHALHTLRGSSRTAGVDAIAELRAPLEKYCQECSQQNQEIQGQNFDIVVACVANFKHLIAEQRDNPQESKLDAELLNQVNDLKVDEVPVSQKEIAAVDEGQKDDFDEAQFTTIEDANSSTKIDPGNIDRYEDKDAGLVEIFLEEAGDILATCNDCLDKWRTNTKDENSVPEFRRQLHTLKGSARMVAYTNIGDFTHAIEALVIPIAKGNLEASQDSFSLLQECLDSLHEMIDEAVAQQPIYPATSLIAELNAVRGGGDRAHEEVDEVASKQTFTTLAKSENKEHDEPDSKQDANISVLPSVAKRNNQQSAQPVIASQQAVRLQANILDNLVNNAGEVNIFQARLEQVTSKYTSSISELEQTIGRLREQLRNLEIETEAQILSRHAHETPDQEHFDPLELDRYSDIQLFSRSLSESANDLLSIKDILFDQVRDSEMLLLQQHRISSDLQEGLMRTRMVAFNQLVPRLQRIVRQTARELDKDADLKVIGADTEVDSSILNRVVAPLEHLVRNSIAHGIEDKAQRERADKSKGGEVSISVSREGAEIVIEVSDDGAGIDPEKVKKKALELGLIKNADLPDREALNLILAPGFSTAGKVTQVSGRGVGMDVVASELKQLGGFLQIDSVPGGGAKFTIRIPFTLAITQALLIKCVDETYAIPLVSIEGVVRLPAHELKQKYEGDNAIYHYAGKDYRLCHLGALLGVGQPQLDGADNMFPVLLVRSGDSRLAIHVEASLGNREIVVKPLVSQLNHLPAISGATISGDGAVMLVLDIQGLMRLESIGQLEYVAQHHSSVSNQKIPTVLVVDDSITIRKVTTRFLERNNYHVVTAKDGVDAVQTLQDITPDMILLDIEMPRMDGYELATHVRNNARSKDVPIIMITSRTGDKHRRRALAIGVQKYLGKPYNEVELLSHIEACIN